MITFLRRCFTLIDRSARRNFLLYAVASIVVTAVEAAALASMIPLMNLLLAEDGDPVPGVARRVGDVFGLTERLDIAGVLGIIVVVLFVIKSVTSLALLRWTVTNSLREEASLARRLFSLYLHAPATFHMRTNSAVIQRTLNESLLLVFRRTLPFALAAGADMFTLAAIAAVVLVSSPATAAVAVFYFAAVGVFYQRFIGGRHKEAARAANWEAFARYQQVQEPLQATREIAVSHRHDYFVDRFYNTKLDLVGAQRTLVFYQLAPRYFLDLAFVLGGALMVAVSFARNDTAESLSAIGLFLAASVRIIGPLNRLLSLVTQARAAGPHLDNIVGDLTTLEGVQTHHTESTAPSPERPLITFDAVSFAYDPDDGDVLRGVDLRIEPGSEIGIVGTSGAGKTTLLGLLLGLLDPTSGEVRLDDTPLSECRTDWQQRLGYVPQEIILVDTTIRANVLFGLDDVDDDRLAEVLRITQLDEFVASLPDGLDTLVGEMGLRLSGGQRQRLGLARALYRQPAVLVLDEATSALDSDTEARLVAALEDDATARTTVIVSHRLSALTRCDRVYFLRDGVVAAAGTLTELAESEPDFANMVKLSQVPDTAAPLATDV